VRTLILRAKTGNELGGISVDDEEMKDPDPDKWTGIGASGRVLLESRTSLGDPGYLPYDLFAITEADV